MLVLLVCVACALPGCGTSESDQVKAKVAQFGAAVQSHDAGTLCDQVLAPSLIDDLTSVGLKCRRAMQIFFHSVHNPTLAIGRVVINGKQAQALTLSGASHQIGALDAVDLIDTSNGWRVTGTGSPLLPGKPSKKK